MRISVLGSGVVGVTLANGLQQVGHEVSVGSRSGGDVEGWHGRVGTFAELAADGEVAVLCVKGAVAVGLVSTLGDALSGTIVLDTTNPIGPEAPTDGVLSWFVGPDESLLERLQVAAPQARFVKAFNSVGAGRMVQPRYAEGRPSMFICGDDTEARDLVAGLADELGWDVEDMGGAAAARAIEPLCRLWCISGFTDGEWTHAFKVLHTDHQADSDD